MKKQIISIITIFLFLNLCLVGFAQNASVDSLLNSLKTDKADTNKLIHLYKLSDEFEINGNYKEGLKYGNQALDLADIILNGSAVEKNQKIKHAAKYYKAKTYLNIGIICDDQGNYPEALKNYFSSLKIRKEMGDMAGVSACYCNIGLIYYNQGDYPQALKNFFASLKINEETGDKEGLAYVYNNLGNLYKNQGNYPEALKNHFAALKIREALGDKQSIAASYNNLGTVYYAQGNNSEALKNLEASFKIKESIKDSVGMAYSYNNIGSIYDENGNYPEAFRNYFASLKIQEKIGYKAGTVSNQINIGALFTKQKKYKEAEHYLIRAKITAKEIGHLEYLRDAYIGLTKLDSAKGDFKGAYENHKRYIISRDSMDNVETRKKTIQSQMTYDFEKKEAVASAEHKKELENQDALAEEKSRKQKAIIGFVGFGLLLVLVFSGFIFRSLRLTRRQKALIVEQKELVEHQKLQVEEHQKEIVDSITYAKRIQFTLLANKQLLDANLPEHFVLFKPKDIVSGDFYWATEKSNSKFQISKFEANELKSETSDRFYIAACDSTGHGVPGAFMSLLNISFLNEAVNERNIVEPHEILNHVRKRLIENMDGGQDGMDCILVCIEKSNFENESNSPLKRGAGGIKITYAAANNSPTIIKNGKLISLEADKMPVGKGEKGESFTLRTIDVEKEDTLYLYTDGYADQFGGSKGKKFKYKPLEDLLVSVSNLPPVDQSKILNQRFEDWKGNLEQVDDMLVIGIKI